MINFAIVISILYFFALKPLLKVMNDRTVRIEKGLEDAKNIEKKLAETEGDYQKKLDEAKKVASNILEKANEQAEKRREQMITKAKAEIGQIINDEKEQIQAEKAKILLEIKKEVSGLVIASMEKVLKKKIDSAEDKRLIEKMIEK